MQPQAQQVFRDAYMVEFLGLPEPHSEADLHRGLLVRLRDFLPDKRLLQQKLHEFYQLNLSEAEGLSG